MWAKSRRWPRGGPGPCRTARAGVLCIVSLFCVKKKGKKKQTKKLTGTKTKTKTQKFILYVPEPVCKLFGAVGGAGALVYRHAGVPLAQGPRSRVPHAPRSLCGLGWEPGPGSPAAPGLPRASKVAFPTARSDKCLLQPSHGAHLCVCTY